MGNVNNIPDHKNRPGLCTLYSLDDIFISLNSMQVHLEQSTLRLEALVDDMIEFDSKLTALHNGLKAILEAQFSPKPKDSDNGN